MNITAVQFVGVPFDIFVAMMLGGLAIGFIVAIAGNPKSALDFARPISVSLAWTMLLMVVLALFDVETLQIARDPDTLLMVWVVGAIVAPYVVAAIPRLVKKFLTSENGEKS